jgi:hypothetical protein
MLVGDFHTHPGFKTQGYSPFPDLADSGLNFARGVPGLVISEGMKIYDTGPDRRGSDPELAKDPKQVPGYPGNSANNKNCH